MRFSFVTLFPSIIEGYFSDTILCRALESGKISIDFYNPRDYTTNKHQKVDAQMVGGGAGMIMTPQPLYDTLDAIKSENKHIIFLTPVGKKFTQNDAKRLASKEHIVLVSGRYEGIDERVIEEYADELFSIGDYILTGGEVASMVLSDAISRNIDGVLGNSGSLDIESYEDNILEAPSFSKPLSYHNRGVISEYSKGNHSKISQLKLKLSEAKTKYFRPDL
ncbi:tRNA (Guanine37-N1)-methyltransferase [hydrothermal vent metagenome]|uniref:tRNA (guanine-N(1)-)-methyltransferase n=1 Tax=hydrothermal vent metagenome TaxID=652676 RepID=A0A1W1EI31_9ZZZZ